MIMLFTSGRRKNSFALVRNTLKKLFMKASDAAPFLLALLVVLASPSFAQLRKMKRDASISHPSATTVKGVVTGRITDERGTPLGAVTVYAGHTTWYNANVIGKTDADGRYKLDITARPGTYAIHAEMTRQHNGVDYKFDLYPQDKTPVSSTEGGVRNIVWKKPVNITATEWDGVGGFVNFMPERRGEDYWDVSDVELTLVPIGLLADGSKGDTIKAKAVNFTAVTGIYNNTGFCNVPIGWYKISARYVPLDGMPVNLLITALKKMNWVKELTTDFAQSSLGYQEIAMLLKFPG
jgi:hypothetical protein